MAKILDDDIWCCDDCLILIANGDSSGMDDATEKRCTEAIAAHPGILVCNDQGDDEEFSHRACDVCGAAGGRRHRLAALEDE
jgi:hypothetical protein